MTSQCPGDRQAYGQMEKVVQFTWDRNPTGYADSFELDGASVFITEEKDAMHLSRKP